MGCGWWPSTKADAEKEIVADLWEQIASASEDTGGLRREQLCEDFRSNCVCVCVCVQGIGFGKGWDPLIVIQGKSQ